jgi:hypothetical protein
LGTELLTVFLRDFNFLNAYYKLQTSCNPLKNGEFFSLN